MLIGLLEYYHENDEGEFLTADEIKSICNLTISGIMIFKVLDSLVARKLVEAHGDNGGDVAFSLTIKGIESAERSAASLDVASKAISTIPASDRLVLIDNNSENAAIEAVDDAIEAIRVSNTVPEDKKGWLRSHLEAGKLLIRAKKITTTALRSILLQPLYSAWKVVGEDVGKQILMNAIRAIKALAGWN